MKIHNLCFSFDDNIVFDNLNLDIQENQITALMAPSGRGKTTLLRLIAGLIKPQSGNIDDGNQTVGIMFQEPRLFGQLTVLQNVMIVMDKKKDRKTIALQLLQDFGLFDVADKYPDQLSGGMAQRVSLARAIAYDADILLLDEPFSSIDNDTKQAVMRKTKQLLEGKTVLFVTHDPEDAKAFSERTIVLS